MGAIGRAHFELVGGQRGVVRWVVTTVLLVVIFIVVQSRVGVGAGPVFQSNMQVPLSLGLLFLLVIAVNVRIGRAMKVDGAVDMWRSHRLMPESAYVAVVGFLLGPAASVFAASGVLVGTGVIARAVRGTDPTPWLVTVFLVTCFASVTWFLTIANGIGRTGKAAQASPMAWLPWVLIGPMLGSGGAILAIFPLAVVLAGPFVGPSVLGMMTIDDVTRAQIISAAIHVALAGLLFAAAIRKYRHAGRPGFSPLMWIFLYCLVGAGTFLGIVDFERFRPGIFGDMMAEPWLAGPLSLMLLVFAMTSPISMAETQASALRLRRNLGDAETDPPFRWMSSPVLALLLSITAIAPFAALAPTVADDRPVLAVLLPTIASFAMSVVLVWAMTRGFTRLGRRSWASIILLAYWILPFIAAAAVAIYRYQDVDTILGPISSISPLGFLVSLWAGEPTLMPLTLGAQAAITAAGTGGSLLLKDRDDQPVAPAFSAYAAAA